MALGTMSANSDFSTSSASWNEPKMTAAAIAVR